MIERYENEKLEPIRDIVDRVAALSSGFPFVLLPVRIETRFRDVELEVPDAATDADEIVELIRKLPIPRGAGRGEAAKKAFRTLHRALEAVRRRAKGARTTTPAAQRELALLAGEAHVLQRLKAFSSSFRSREGSGRRLAKQVTTTLRTVAEPLFEELRAQTLPRLELAAALRPLGEEAVCALGERLSALAAALAGCGEAAPRELRARWRQLKPELEVALRGVRAVVPRSEPLLCAREALGRALDELAQAPAAASFVGEITTARRQLGRVRHVTAKAIAASADAVVRAEAMLGSRTGSDRPDRSVVEDATQLERELRCVALAPVDRVRSLRRAAEPLLSDLARQASVKGLDPARSRDRARLVLARRAQSLHDAIRRRLLALPTDGLDGDGGGEDVVTVTVPAVATKVQTQLLVRIFPDELFVSGHVPELTDAERASGAHYWTQVRSGPQGAEEIEWIALCRRHGASRAAWIRRQTERVRSAVRRSSTEGELTAAIERLKALLRPDQRRSAGGAYLKIGEIERGLEEIRTASEGVERFHPLTRRRARDLLVQLESRVKEGVLRAGPIRTAEAKNKEQDRVKRDRWEALATSVAALKRDAERWPSTPAPLPSETPSPRVSSNRSPVLPRCFVVVGVQQGRISLVARGSDVKPDLALGIDPTKHEIRIQGDGLEVPEELRWLFQFDAAEQAGMAIRAPLETSDDAIRFDRLYVLGLCEGAPDEQADALASLLEGHHYGPRGLSVLPYGAATNSTDKKKSAWQRTADPGELLALETRPTLDAECDAARLARVLGVDAGVFQAIACADERSLADAEVVRRSLYWGTLGAYLEDFLPALLPRTWREHIGTFFRDHVSPRGFAPTLRIGAQPYGVLVTHAHSRFVASDPERTLHTFSKKVLSDFLATAEHAAARVRAPLKQGQDARQRFLDVLGLHASGLSYASRLAINAALRSEGSEPPSTGAGALFTRFGELFQAGTRTPEQNAQYWNDELRRNRAYDLRMLVKDKAATRSLIEPDHGTWIPELLSKSLVELADAASGVAPQPGSLLRVFLRQALLYRALLSGAEILQREGLLTEKIWNRIGSADAFIVDTLLADAEHISKFTYLFQPLSNLDGRFGATLGGALLAHLGGKPLCELVESTSTPNVLFDSYPGVGAHSASKQAVEAHRRDVEGLMRISSDRLPALVAEHIDTLSHRLDAWVLGFAGKRLDELRETNPTGAYLGAFGMVENLERVETIVPAADVPAALAAGPMIRHDPYSQGFIHAPSMNHAVCAAILRSGYMADADVPDADNRMAVNLSSRRVRLALELVEGIRGGSSLGVLLGYRLERALHDRSLPPLYYDEVIYELRKVYPGHASHDPEASMKHVPRAVVDGLAVLDAAREWTKGRAGSFLERMLDATAQGTTIAGLPPSGDPKLRGVLECIDAMLDSLDALSDLALSEGVYQIASGREARGASALLALAEGRAPGRPEIVDFPSSGSVVGHRVVLCVDAQTTKAPPGWPQGMTPRAAAEPGFNDFLGRILGDADDIRCKVLTAHGSEVVTARQLLLQPIDLFCMVGKGSAAGLADLRARIARAAKVAIEDLAAAVVDLAAGAEASSSFDDALSMLEAVGDAIAEARSLLASDLLPEHCPVDATSAPDLAEIELRVAAAEGALVQLGVAVVEVFDAAQAAALRAKPPAIRRDELRDSETLRASIVELANQRRGAGALSATDLESCLDVFEQASNLGMPWPSLSGLDAGALTAVVVDGLTAAILEARRRLQGLQTASRGTARGSLDALSALFGEGFIALPRFVAPDASSCGGGEVAVDAVELSDFFVGVSAVRRPVRRVTQALDLAELLGRDRFDFQVLQYPSGPWRARQLTPTPDTNTLREDDALCIEALSLPKSGARCAGLVLDAWTELIPRPTAATGIAISYDQPDATPPQSMLVVVPPTGPDSNWQWLDIVRAVDETFDLAKVRALEPDQLAGTLYAQLLPMVMGEIVPKALPPEAPVPPGNRMLADFGTPGGAP